MDTPRPSALVALLVDDSAADALVNRRALERDPDARWTLFHVETAEAGLAWLVERVPDVVLMDFNLPGMDGLQLLGAMRRRLGERMPAVVVLTGSGSEEVAVAAMRLGAQDYLVKGNYGPERLRQSVHAAVERVQLARVNEERRRATERAERALREALAVRDELFALATHDLKTPLQIIQLTAESLKVKLPPEARALAEARLQKIIESSQRMNRLIEHFLKATRSESAATLERTELDLAELVRHKLRELEPAAARHPMKLVLEGRDFHGRWHAPSLERVLENLLSNAVKYSPQGGEVVVRLFEEEDGWLRLEVEDRGVGIPEEDLPFVFERFRRGTNVSAHITGTGVGLASVRRLVELHGGTVEVTSREGEGSCFIVRLPREFELAPDALMPQVPPAPEGAPA